jgi:hypothetical protein
MMGMAFLASIAWGLYLTAWALLRVVAGPI